MFFIRFSEALGGVCGHGLDLFSFFLFPFFTLTTTVSYIRTFVYPGWAAFFGFQSKKVPLMKICICYYYYFVNRRSWYERGKFRHQGQREGGSEGYLGTKTCLRDQT